VWWALTDEHATIAIIAIALRRRTVRPQNGMPFQFDVEHLHAMRMIVPQDRAMIHQVLDRD
jgi:hypothetical protein